MRDLVKNVKVSIMRWGELTSEDQDLLTIAKEARANAVAAYSHHTVGAAIKWRRGSISRGCNVENCVYEVLHAERNAIGNGILQNGLDKINKVAVVGGPEDQELPPPAMTNLEFEAAAAQITFDDAYVCCANCLQDVIEFVFGDSTVELMRFTKGLVIKMTVGDVLTTRFEPKHLDIDYGKQVAQQTEG